MTRVLSIPSFIALILFGVFQASGNPRAANHSAQDDFVFLDPVDFHYIIYRNSVNESGIRNIRILMQADAFSAVNLKKLFSVLSKGYPSPDFFLVEVITDVKQALPEGVAEYSEGPDNPDFDKYHSAVYERCGDNEFFRYDPSPPNRELTTVILRGKDPHR